MTIETRLTEKEFVQVNFVLLYKKPLIKIVTVLAIIFLLLVPIGVIDAPKSFDFTNLIFPFLFAVVVPLSVYSSAKKTYKTNHQVLEKATYHFSKEQLFIAGETYTVTYQWNTIYEVTQTKNWILIWPNKLKSHPLPAKDLWGGQIAEIKDLLESNGVKNNLKYLP